MSYNPFYDTIMTYHLCKTLMTQLVGLEVWNRNVGFRNFTLLLIPCTFIIVTLSKKFPTVMHRLVILKRYYKVIPFSEMYQWWPPCCYKA
jgi:hypothetical protein